MFLRKRELVSRKVIYNNEILPPSSMKYADMIRTSVIEEYWKDKWFWNSDYTYEEIYVILQNDDINIKNIFDTIDDQLIRQKYLDEEYLAKLAIINYKCNKNKLLNNTNID